MPATMRVEMALQWRYVLGVAADWGLLGRDVRALLHQAAPVVPEAVVQRQLVLQLLRLLHTRVRVLPLERSQPAASYN